MNEKYKIGYVENEDGSYHCFIDFGHDKIWKSNVIYRTAEEAFETCFKWEKLIAKYDSISILKPLTHKLLPVRSIMENKALENRVTVIGSNLTLAEI